jgi:hypothetical protein
MEIWKKIENYPNYEISNLGNVKSYNFIKLKNLKLELNLGYYRVMLCNNGIKKRFFVHRLVAKAFIKNEKNKPQVNHIDECPKNNNANNLEWVTHRENIEYSRTKKGITKIKGVNWIERMKSYQCSIYYNNKKHYLGSSKDIEKAKKLVENFLIKNNLN